MMTDIFLLEQGTHPGVVIVFDMEGCSWGHFLKVNLSSTRNHMNYLQEAMPVRIKGLVQFNLPSFFDKAYRMAKPLIKDNILRLVHLSVDIEGTYDVVPPECFPSDYPNGKGPSLDEMHGKICIMLRKRIRIHGYKHMRLRSDMLKLAVDCKDFC